METAMNREEKVMERAVVGGSSTEMIAGAAVVVLSILGLVHVAPHFMIAAASIALGAALILDGAAISAEYSRILSERGNGKVNTIGLGGGLGMQFGGGVAAVVLGVLALLGVASATLMAIAAIVLGATMVLSSGVNTRLNALKVDHSGGHAVAKRIAREAVMAATGTGILVGLAAGVLGILALVGIAPQTLILVAMLALGASALLTGGALVGKMLSIFTG